MTLELALDYIEQHLWFVILLFYYINKMCCLLLQQYLILEVFRLHLHVMQFSLWDSFRAHPLHFLFDHLDASGIIYNQALKVAELMRLRVHMIT